MLVILFSMHEAPLRGWRSRGQVVIFEADTRLGRFFDLALIVCIVASVVVVMMDSIGELRSKYGAVLHFFEWFFTILFTIEYVVRLLCVGHPWKYVRSCFGVIDLLGFLPTYVSLFLPGSQYLLTFRVLRLLRIFRVLKLAKYVGEARFLSQALRASRRKIFVFLYTVMTMVVVLGSLMYVIEGEEAGFTSIPVSVYWAIVTLTTVGYGDISPQSPLGQSFAALIMIMGYSVIAIPTGIVTAEMVYHASVSTEACPQCSTEGHDLDAKHCKMCGAEL
jgi:voltage-gated potassium channel